MPQAQAPTQPLVLTRVEGHVGVLTLNSSATMNTLDGPMLLAMEQGLQTLESDAQVRVIVVTGADERTFMAGGNIAYMKELRVLDYYETFSNLILRVFRRFEECPKPTIAAVNGWALGGGCEFMLTLDMRLMAEEAQIGLPEIKLGIFPGGGGTQRLIRQIPMCHAKQLLFTGDFVSADEALSIGLVNRAVPRKDLMHEAMALAARIASRSPSALRLLKRTVVQGAEMPLPTALAHEATAIALLFDSEDARESMSAFLEKREARITGR
ncbi:enoyl-CoA hydratase-related protein [Comamonas sp. A7-5]|uniref:enoyl-CoA hydratase/isomerase family protein n=1 Tax=Comamonas sp. A7-5 TaxID=673549 RepID=UPI0031E19EEC